MTCKTASLSHIAHNVKFESDCAVISCASIMGSVQIKENVCISFSTIRNQCTIGKNAVIGMGAVVVKDVEANKTVIGNPARVFEKSEVRA